MAIYRTLFCVPNATLGSLTHPVTFPVDVNSSVGINAGAPPVEHRGFGADIPSLIHRNWKPYSWDITGSATSGFSTLGYLTRPGPIGSDTVNYTDLFEGTHTATWNGTAFHPTKAQPDFSDESNVRQMIAWNGGGDGFSPDIKKVYNSSVFPVFSPGGGGTNQTGWYIETTFRPFARLGPYYWEDGGQYFCTHEIRMDVVTRGVPSPGTEPPDDWLLVEGASLTDFGPSSTSRADETGGGQVALGSATITDVTGIDPSSNWGSVTMWQVFNISTPATLPIELTLRVRSNFLPFPNFE